MNQTNKKIVWDCWQRLNHAPLEQIPAVLSSAMHPNTEWHGPHPINDINGIESLISGFWRPFRTAFPDLTRTVDIFLGGDDDGYQWVTATGYFTGTFQHDWQMPSASIAATGKKTYIRFGEFCVMRDGLITETFIILDLLDVLRQCGFQLLPPSRGADGGRVPPPHSNDGVMLLEQDPLESRKTVQLVNAMIDGMYRFDGHNLASMEQEHYWHPQFRWFGPSGIGTSRSLTEYQEFHQGPWLKAFPDRGTSRQGSNSGRRMGFVAEGNYAAGGIWDWEYATQTGELLGLPATGKAITIRDFDWWKREGNLLVENWIPIDIIDIFYQLGVDLFAKMEEMKKTS